MKRNLPRAHFSKCASPFLLTCPARRQRIHTPIHPRPNIQAHGEGVKRMSAWNRLFLNSDPAVLLSPCHFHFERLCLDTGRPPWNPNVWTPHAHTQTHTLGLLSCLFLMQRMLFSLWVDNGVVLSHHFYSCLSHIWQYNQMSWLMGFHPLWILKSKGCNYTALPECQPDGRQMEFPQQFTGRSTTLKRTWTCKWWCSDILLQILHL